MDHSDEAQTGRRMGETAVRVLYALAGAFLGALIAIGVLWWIDTMNWVFVAVCAAICAILAAAFGEPALDWLKDIWWWT